MAVEKLVVDEIDAYLDVNYPREKGFWLSNSGVEPFEENIVNIVDCLYVLFLLGRLEAVSRDAIERYVNFIKRAPLFGMGSEEPFNPHSTAYILGGLNIISGIDESYRREGLSSLVIDMSHMLDANLLPKWPKKWSHHSWRVSHWIGGIPSILLTFSRHDPKEQVKSDLVKQVLQACDSNIVDPETGVLKAYKSALIQLAFRMAYRLRHNPIHGDIGGIVHIHWINHAIDRPYMGIEHLSNVCREELQSASPFLESVPYCLDFDFVQLFRTALQQTDQKCSEFDSELFNSIGTGIEEFIVNDLNKVDYDLHKLPGALATLHEVSLNKGQSMVSSLGVPAIDIIRTAYWL